MYARNKSHDDATLSYMADALRRFHTFKDVFLLGQAGENVKTKANDPRMALMKKRKGDKETNTETWTPFKKQREMNSGQD